MAPSDEIERDFPGFFKVYNDGRVQRYWDTGDHVPAGLDSETGVETKDVVISQQTGVKARLYLPKQVEPGQKLPLLVYYHGGGFVIETAFSPTYHNHLNILVAEANVIAVSVDYRRAPECPIPIPYEDCWAALKWAGSHAGGSGPEEWLNEHADFGSVFLAGDSAGANIVHHVAMRFGQEEIEGIPQLGGLVMIHPYFAGNEPVGNEPVSRASSSTSGLDDPYINPAFDPKLAGLGCSKVLVMVAEKDFLRDRGNYYYELLKGSGWKGEVEIVETNGEDHVFHLKDNDCANAVNLRKKICSFINN
ncbi:Probable carboxylesterase 7 [Linum perenne]